MFILQSSKPSYGSHAFASSSCQTEFNGKMESTTPKLGSLSKSLRRNSSNLSQLSSIDMCSADATQVEIDVTSMTTSEFLVSVQTPTGESGVLEFHQCGTARVFKPSHHGCGHGVWIIRVYQKIDNSEAILRQESIQLDGVGTLFFSVGDDFQPRLTEQEFLYMSGICAKHHH